MSLGEYTACTHGGDREIKHVKKGKDESRFRGKRMGSGNRRETGR